MLIRKSKSLNICLIACAFICLCGCQSDNKYVSNRGPENCPNYIFGDGFILYTISGTLTGSIGNPLGNTQIYFYAKQQLDIPPEDLETEEVIRTDKNGGFTQTILADGWYASYCPETEKPPQAPFPEKPKVLYLLYQDINKQWHQTEITVTEKHIKKVERGELYIRLDKIQLQ